MRKILATVFLALVGLVVLLTLDTPKTEAGRQFSTTYDWLDDAESTSLVQETLGATSQAGAKIGLVSWAKDFTTLTVVVRGVYVATPVADTCTAMWDNLATDTLGIDVWTGDDAFDYRKKIYTYKYFMDSTYKAFTVPAESSIASNCWFQIRSWIKDSSNACAVTGTDKGVRYQATLKAWGK